MKNLKTRSLDQLFFIAGPQCAACYKELSDSWHEDIKSFLAFSRWGSGKSMEFFQNKLKVKAFKYDIDELSH